MKMSEKAKKKTNNGGRDNKGRYAKGTAPGRSKGSTNKFTDLKVEFFKVFNKIEADSQKKNSKIDSFFVWATKNENNQRVFYCLIAKMLPTSVSLEGAVPITFEVSEKFMPRIKNTTPKSKPNSKKKKKDKNAE